MRGKDIAKVVNVGIGYKITFFNHHHNLRQSLPKAVAKQGLHVCFNSLCSQILPCDLTIEGFVKNLEKGNEI